jgi:hypothetical protein
MEHLHHLNFVWSIYCPHCNGNHWTRILLRISKITENLFKKIFHHLSFLCDTLLEPAVSVSSSSTFVRFSDWFSVGWLCVAIICRGLPSLNAALHIYILVKFSRFAGYLSGDAFQDPSPCLIFTKTVKAHENYFFKRLRSTVHDSLFNIYFNVLTCAPDAILSS